MVLSIDEAKAHSEDGQGQGEQPSKDKQDGPYGEAGRHEGSSDNWFKTLYVTIHSVLQLKGQVMQKSVFSDSNESPAGIFTIH